MDACKNIIITKSKSTEYKNIEGYQIIYGTGETKFGKCLMGLKGNQVCYASFTDGIFTDLTELKNTFKKAVFLQNDNLIQQKIQEYFDGGEKPELLLTGTDFQIKVWEYLVGLPKGKTTYYEQVAKGVNHPKAIRAVANAIASNKIAYLVPCHRVVSKSGALTKFKWGTERKKKMLRSEEAV